MLTPVRPNPPRCEVNSEVLDYITRMESCCDKLQQRCEKQSSIASRYESLLGKILFAFCTDPDRYDGEKELFETEWLLEILEPKKAKALGLMGLSLREITTLMRFYGDTEPTYAEHKRKAKHGEG